MLCLTAKHAAIDLYGPMPGPAGRLSCDLESRPAGARRRLANRRRRTAAVSHG